MNYGTPIRDRIAHDDFKNSIKNFIENKWHNNWIQLNSLGSHSNFGDLYL